MFSEISIDQNDTNYKQYLFAKSIKSSFSPSKNRFTIVYIETL